MDGLSVDMGTMYELLSSLENGLDFMVSEFEQHLQETGLKKMQALANDNEVSWTPKQHEFLVFFVIIILVLKLKIVFFPSF